MQASDATNAGVGSNLSFEGTVEADASIMLGDGTFGAVGALPGTRPVSPLLIVRLQPCLLTEVGPADVLSRAELQNMSGTVLAWHFLIILLQTCVCFVVKHPGLTYHDAVRCMHACMCIAAKACPLFSRIR